METLVLSAQDCPKDGWLKGGTPRMFAWQGDEYSYCSHLGQTCSDLSEQMHAICGCYMPADFLPYGSHSITEKHFFFATSVIESRTSRCNNVKYQAAPTWHHSIASSQMNHQPRDIHSGIQGCRSRSALHRWTFTKARNYEITGQAFCRTTPMARASSLELFTRESLPTHSLEPPKTRKHFTNRANIGGRERSSPATQKFSSCKDSDICGRAVVYLEDEANSMSYEPMRNRLANKAPQRDEKVGCNMRWTASPKPNQILSVRTNCMKKDGKEPLHCINGAPLDRIKAGQERECSSMIGIEGKAILCHSRPSSKRDINKDNCKGLMPFDADVTSTRLAIKGYSQEGSQSVHSLPMKERWAGPAFSNSPPPSSLPVPTFTRRQLRTSSLEIPRAEADFLTDLIKRRGIFLTS